jgi:LacI family transcriptional regulator
VSRALHDYDDVSPETKALVRQVAEEMGYIANKQALGLQKRRSDAIGLILPTFGPRFSDPFYSEFIAGVGKKASQFERDLVVSAYPPGEQEIQAYRQLVQSRRVDGFVIVRVRAVDERIDLLRQRGVPFVAFGRTRAAQDYPFVDEDGASGMRQVVDHLVALGHRKLAFIAPPENLNFTHLRLQGFHAACQAHGLEIRTEWLREGDLTQRGGFEQAQALLSLDDPPTAILAGNDLTAFGVMSAVQEHGLQVGKDISVTGFDDIPMAEHSHPPLTTVHQPIYTIGNMVCEMLIDLIDGRLNGMPQTVLDPQLIVRSSSGPPP